MRKRYVGDGNLFSAAGAGTARAAVAYSQRILVYLLVLDLGFRIDVESGVMWRGTEGSSAKLMIRTEGEHTA